MEPSCSVHKLIADVALFAGNRVLLVKYKDIRRYDGQRGWFLPDDFLAYTEHPDDAARRIAKDQTGITIARPSLNHIESFGNGAWHMAFHYVFNVSGRTKVVPDAKVAAFEWFDRKQLPPPHEVAHHGWALDVLKKISKGRGR